MDLHNHLLPGVDDGSRTWEETCAHLARWFASGVSAATLTPHLLVPKLATEADVEARLDALNAVFEALAARIGSRTDLPELKLGQEVLAPNGSVMRRVAQNRRVGLGETDHVLVEFGFSPDFDADGTIDAALAAGRLPVIAHPERYAFPAGADAVSTIAAWRNRGALLQVNGGSLRGRYGERIQQRARRLVTEELATIVASDHHGDSRPDDPLDTWLLLTELVGERRADLLLAERPRRIFEGHSEGEAEKHRAAS